MCNRGIFYLAGFLLLLIPITASAVPLNVSDPVISDVTTGQFSVIWSANQPSTPDLEVYSDDGGTTPVAGSTIINESGANTPAEDNGVMKVTAQGGLTPGAIYYFKTVTTSKDSGEIKTSALYPVQMGVTGDFASNDKLAIRIFKEGTQVGGQNDSANYANGTLLVVSTALAMYPVSNWVGKDIPAPWAGAVMSNFILASDRKPYNMNSAGGEELQIRAFGGLLGEANETHTATAKTQGFQQADPNFINLTGAASAVTAEVIYMRNHHGFQLEFIVEGDLTDVTAVTVDGPTGSGIAGVNLIKIGNEFSNFYPDGSSLTQVPASGNYTFNFTGGSTAQLVVDFQPGTPMDLPVITTPITFPNVTWGAVTGATAYYVNIYDSNVMSLYQGEDNKFTQTSVDLSTPMAAAPDGDYKIHAVAVDANGNEAYSAMVDFTKGVPQRPTGSFESHHYYELDFGGWFDLGLFATSYMLHFDGTNLNTQSPGGTIFDEGTDLPLNQTGFDNITITRRTDSAVAVVGHVYSIVIGNFKLLLKVTDISGTVSKTITFEFFVMGGVPGEDKVTLAGTVKCSVSGTPVDNITVDLYKNSYEPNQPDTFLATTATADGGAFTFTQVNPWDSVYFKLTDSGGTYNETYSFVYFPDNISKEADFTLKIVPADRAATLGVSTTNGLVAGKVKDSSGNAYAGAEISVMSLTPGIILSGFSIIYLDENGSLDTAMTKTGSSGGFVVTGLPAGIKVNLYAFDPNDYNKIFMGRDAISVAGAVTMGPIKETSFTPGGDTIDVNGRVIDINSVFPDNKIPLSDITVKLKGEDTTTATTGTEGFFTISVDKAVPFFLTMGGSVWGYMPTRTWQIMPDATGYSMSISALVLATSSDLTNLGYAPVSGTGTVYGAFKSDIGEGMAGVKFTLESQSGSIVYNTVTDNQGRFIFGSVTPGDYELNYFGGSIRLKVEADTVTTGPVLFAGGGTDIGGKGDITGTVYYAGSGGSGYSGDVTLTLWTTPDYFEANPYTQSVTVTSGSGEYTFTSVDAGTYFLTGGLTDPGSGAYIAVGSYKPVIDLSSSGKSGADFGLVDIPTGSTVTIMGKLFNPFDVTFNTGTNNFEPSPVPGLTVYQAHNYLKNATSGNDGTFTISGLPAGTIITLIIQGPGFTTLNTRKFKIPSTDMTSPDIEIPVVDEQFVNGVLWNLPGVDFKEKGIVIGRANTASGESLAGVAVSLDPPSGTVAYMGMWGPDAAMTMTGEEGRFAAYNVSSGLYNLYGDKAGYDFAPYFTAVYPGVVAIGQLVGTSKAAACTEDNIKSAIEKGLAWLANRQDTVSGAFGAEYMLGVTELAALSFMNNGHYASGPITDPYSSVVRQALRLVVNQQDLYDPNETERYGAIYEAFTGGDRGYVNNYTTAIGILALATADRNNTTKEYTDKIMAAAAYLVRAQNGNNAANNAGYQDTNAHYGGWGYGWPDQTYRWADLSNTQFVLLGLDAAKRSIHADTTLTNDQNALDLVAAIDTAFDRSMVFLQRCQNLDLVNDMDWANGKTDGGFIYNPDMGFEDFAGMMDSYGAMTYAGIWSYHLNGLTPDDPRMAAALNWAANNFAVDYHAPWMGDKHSLYYYYLSLAKALSMVGTAADDVSPTWYGQLACELVNRQRTDGYWVNFNTGEGEGIKELTTSYALLSLATQRVPTGGSVIVSITGSQTITVTVPGTTPYTKTANSSSPFELPDQDENKVVGGVYKVKVGGSAGSYTLTIKGFIGDTEVSSDVVTEELQENEEHYYQFVVTAIEGFATRLLRKIPNSNIPFIILTRPEAGDYTADDAFLITWIDGGFEGDATIHLFAKTGVESYSEITNPSTGLSKDNDHNYFEWDTSDPNLDGNTYTINATISGGADNVSDGSVTISQDGMPRSWEEANKLNIYRNDGGRDPDHDDLTNAEEYAAGTNPNKKDTDDDKMPDKYEVQYSTGQFTLDPTTADDSQNADSDSGPYTDAEGNYEAAHAWTNIEEYYYGTNPTDPGDMPSQITIYVDGTSQVTPADGSETKPYTSIQAGIDAAKGLNTVSVAPGTYKERIILKNAVKVLGADQDDESRSDFVINGDGGGDVVTVKNLNAGLLKGFTIKNSGTRQENENRHPEGKGKNHRFGIYVDSSNITITKCSIKNNQRGIGVYGNSKPLIKFNVIRNNSSDGIFFRDANSDFENGDETGDFVIARNNTIWKNGDSGIKVFDASPVLFNNIIVNNNRGIDVMGISEEAIIKYNDVYMNNWGIDDYVGIWDKTWVNGNISQDPLFVSTESNNVDLHLQSDSPCLGSGRPAEDFPAWYTDSYYPDGWGYDMGAFKYKAFSFRIDSEPVTAASEGVAYSYQVTTEGQTGTVTFDLAPAIPGDMTITTAGGMITWTPGYRNVQVSVVATDAADGAAYTQTFKIDVVFNDSDNDGLPDTWENVYWPNAWDGIAGTASGDNDDGDNYTNLQEFIADTDPSADNTGSIATYNVADYYPLNQGDTWAYHTKVSDSAAGTEEFYNNAALVNGTMAGSSIPRISWNWGEVYEAVTGNGLERYKRSNFVDNTTEEPSPSLLLLPAQFAVGQTHTATASSGKVSYTATISGIETVDVPAGVFSDCVRVDHETSTPKGSKSCTFWLAQGIGVVKKIVTADGTTKKSSLTSYFVNGVSGGDNPSIGTISGTIWYDAGTETGNVYIGIFDDSNFESATALYKWTLSAPGAYKIPVAEGTYYIGVYMDTNGNQIRENFEPQGAFGIMPDSTIAGMPQSINVFAGFNPTEVDVWIAEVNFIDPGFSKPEQTLYDNAFYDFDFNMFVQETDASWDVKYVSGRLYANTDAGGTIKDWGPVDFTNWDADPTTLDNAIGGVDSVTPQAGNIYTLNYTSDFGEIFVVFRVTSVSSTAGVTFEYIYDFRAGGPEPVPEPGVGERSVSGRVIATDKPEGVDGWWVDAWSESTGSWGGTETADGGYYTITKLTEANDFVVAVWPPVPDPGTGGTAGQMEPPEYQHQFYQGKDNWEDADRQSTVGGDLTGIDFVLSKGKSIAGKVHDGNDNGIANIWVDAYSDSAWFGMGAMTDEAGNYTITGLKDANDYRVQIWSADLNTQVFYYLDVSKGLTVGVDRPESSTPMWDQATFVTPDDPATANIDIIISEGATIEGRVTKGDGVTPIAHVWVNAWSEGLMLNTGAETGSDGTYKIVGLTEVTNPEETVDGIKIGYLVEIWAQRFPYQAYDQASSPEEATLVATGRTDVNFKLSKGVSISGKVEDANGPVRWVRVEAYSESTGNWGDTHSGRNKDGTFNITGFYIITNLPPADDYVVSVWPPDYPGGYWAGKDKPYVDKGEDALHVDLTRGTQTDINFFLSKGALIKGTVYLDDAKTIPAPAGIWVNVSSESTYTGGNAPTGHDGGYEIAGLNADAEDYIINIWHPDYLPTFWSSGGTVNNWGSAGGATPSDTTEYDLVLSTGRSIKGKVTLDGQPVPGIWVDAWSETGGWGGINTRALLIDDGQGGQYNYEITGLPPQNDYQVTITPQNFSSKTYGDPVDVSAGDAVGIDFILSTGRKISGAITGLESGKEVHVHAWSKARGFGKGAHVTGTGGAVDYTITGLKPAEDYKVDIWSSDYLYQAYNGKSTREEADSVNVSESNATGIDFNLSSGVTISGSITFPDGTVANEKVWVDAWSKLTDSWGGTEVTATTGAETYTYEIKGLASTTDFVVSVWSEKYKNIFYDGVSNFEKASKIDTSDGLKDNDINFTLSSGVSISGTVTDENGDGVASTWVDAWSDSTKSWGGAETDAGGKYTIVGLDSATDFTVAAWPEDKPPFFYGLDDDGNIKTVRRLGRAAEVSTASGNVTGIDIVLKEGGSISGTVRDTSGKALSWIRVDAESEAQQSGAGAFTKEDGTFLIRGLTSGNDYKVSVWPSPDSPYIPQVKENISTGDNTLVFTLNTGWTLSGTVRNTSGTAVADVWINIWSQSTDFFGWTETSDTGAYTISGMPTATDYVLFADPPTTSAYVPYFETDISISADTKKDIALSPALSISGHVYQSDGSTGVANVKVTAFSASKEKGGSAETGSDGAYEIPNIPNASDYVVTARPTDYAAQEKTGQSPGSDIDFTLKTGGSITGTVKNESGVGIEGVSVDAYSATLNKAKGTVTNSSGAYTIDGLGATDTKGDTLSDYVVTAKAEGYPPQSQGGKSVGDTGVNFSMSAGDANKIKGIVKDSGDSTTIPTTQILVAQMLVFDSDGFVKRCAGGISKTDGTYECKGLEAGKEYWLKTQVWPNSSAIHSGMPEQEWVCGGPPLYTGKNYSQIQDYKNEASTITTGTSLGDVDIKLSKAWSTIYD